MHLAALDRSSSPLTAEPPTPMHSAKAAGNTTAALWLDANKRDRLLNRYRGTHFLQEVFRHVIMSTAHVPPGWDHLNFGAGIIRADRVVRAEMPLLAPNPVAVIKSVLEWFVSLFAAPQREIARQQLVLLFAGPGGTLTDAELEQRMERYGTELLHLFFTQAPALESFRDSVERRAAGDAQEARARLEEAGAALAQAASDGLNQVANWQP